MNELKGTLNAECIKESLLAKGCSYADLAGKAGIAYITLKKGIDGKPLRPKTIKKIADALGCAPSDLATV